MIHKLGERKNLEAHLHSRNYLRCGHWAGMWGLKHPHLFRKKERTWISSPGTLHIGFAYFREVVEPCLPNLSDKMGSPMVGKCDAYVGNKPLLLQFFHSMVCIKNTVLKALSNVKVSIKL